MGLNIVDVIVFYSMFTNIFKICLLLFSYFLNVFFISLNVFLYTYGVAYMHFS